jgi:pimeloyl-ACP methyl ester carboxylesterase
MTSLIRIQAIVVLLVSGTLTTIAQIPPTPGAGREGYASAPGARLFYTDTAGAGIPVVLLHAATGNTSAWQYQTKAFTTAGYRIIAYDRRGWGRTVVDSSGKILASHIPNAEFLVVRNAGHSVYWEEPELFNGTVLALIRKY